MDAAHEFVAVECGGSGTQPATHLNRGKMVLMLAEADERRTIVKCEHEVREVFNELVCPSLHFNGAVHEQILSNLIQFRKTSEGTRLNDGLLRLSASCPACRFRPKPGTTHTGQERLGARRRDRAAQTPPPFPRATAGAAVDQHGLVSGAAGFDSNLPGFGAFGTTGAHCFNPKSPAYLRIAALIEVRNQYPVLRPQLWVVRALADR